MFCFSRFIVTISINSFIYNRTEKSDPNNEFFIIYQVLASRMQV